MTETQTALPSLLCPNCGVNLLEKGFYNYCTETTSLQEDNYVLKQNGRIYMDHDEHGHETTDHECALDAYCKECEELLPWPLYELRGLDGELFANAEKLITELVAKLPEKNRRYNHE
jgi:hypothetical protein